MITKAGYKKLRTCMLQAFAVLLFAVPVVVAEEIPQPAASDAVLTPLPEALPAVTASTVTSPESEGQPDIKPTLSNGPVDMVTGKAPVAIIPPTDSAQLQTSAGILTDAPVIAEEEAHKKIPSLFFTYWQHQSILDAIAARSEYTTEEEFLDQGFGDENKEKIKPKDRELELSGIVYVHEKDWTIWFNGMRITPNTIPADIMELKVFKTHIDVKWFDKYTNKIFPVRIRPHQRFNLDTRVFLPG